jgi:hypothetical protein
MAARNAKMSFISKFLPARHAGVFLATALLVSCGSSSGTPKGPPQLHLACQTVECECRGERVGLFSDREITEIVWRQNGDATCPTGFVLERVRVDFLGRRK